MIKPVAVALCLLACGGSPDPAPAPLVVPAFPPRMQLAEAQATLSRPRNSLQVSGAGTSRMGAISLRASEGTIELDGASLGAAVIESAPWPQYQLIIHQAVAVGPDRIYVLWLYCSPTDLRTAWVEDTLSGQLTAEGASGSCVDSPIASAPTLRMPAVSAPWPSAVSGFQISGASLSLPSGGPGAVRYGGQVYGVLPFVAVTCAACAGGSAPGGWYELHALLWSPSVPGITIGVLYLYPDDPRRIVFQHAFSLPLRAAPPATFLATWSSPAQ